MLRGWLVLAALALLGHLSGAQIGQQEPGDGVHATVPSPDATRMVNVDTLEELMRTVASEGAHLAQGTWELAYLPCALCPPYGVRPALARRGISASDVLVQYDAGNVVLAGTSPAVHVTLAGVAVTCLDPADVDVASLQSTSDFEADALEDDDASNAEGLTDPAADCAAAVVGSAQELQEVAAALLPTNSTSTRLTLLLSLAGHVSIDAASWSRLVVPGGCQLALYGSQAEETRIDFGGVEAAISVSSRGARLYLYDVTLLGLPYPASISRQEQLVAAFLHSVKQDWLRWGDEAPEAVDVTGLLLEPRTTCTRCALVVPDAEAACLRPQGSQALGSGAPEAVGVQLLADSGVLSVPRVRLVSSTIMPYTLYGTRAAAGAVSAAVAAVGAAWPLAGGGADGGNPPGPPPLGDLSMMTVADPVAQLASCSRTDGQTGIMMVPSARGALAFDRDTPASAALEAQRSAPSQQAAAEAAEAGSGAQREAVLLVSGSLASAQQAAAVVELPEGASCSLVAPPAAQTRRRVAWDAMEGSGSIHIPSTSRLTLEGLILHNMGPSAVEAPAATEAEPSSPDHPLANHSLALPLDVQLQQLKNVTLVVSQAEVDLLLHMLGLAGRLPGGYTSSRRQAMMASATRQLRSAAGSGRRRVLLAGLEDPAASPAAAAAVVASGDAGRWKDCAFSSLVWFAVQSTVSWFTDDTVHLSAMQHLGWSGSDVTITSALPSDAPSALGSSWQSPDDAPIVLDVMAGCPAATGAIPAEDEPVVQAEQPGPQAQSPAAAEASPAAAAAPGSVTNSPSPATNAPRDGSSNGSGSGDASAGGAAAPLGDGSDSSSTAAPLPPAGNGGGGGGGGGSSSNGSAAAFIGAIVGGVCAALLSSVLVAVFVMQQRRRRQLRLKPDIDAGLFMPGSERSGLDTEQPSVSIQLDPEEQVPSVSIQMDADGGMPQSISIPLDAVAGRPHRKRGSTPAGGIMWPTGQSGTPDDGEPSITIQLDTDEPAAGGRHGLHRWSLRVLRHAQHHAGSQQQPAQGTAEAEDDVESPRRSNPGHPAGRR
ncbi:hypothetical protein HYH03_012640 [Edaphochlamys debaryana]|uniref:Uncharacterized protein n=1 Tax=Edaphochlamys debaryana TaxID=47281 RepID=A0A835XTQ7_9CHLO|nr:hypothetical protein HYH03_012640 [Edaphochlamys debaryana]|eukprot:KAG2488843.1 hypothetical protein HYH03_012640 [Edaphochlamys debaryana]